MNMNRRELIKAGVGVAACMAGPAPSELLAAPRGGKDRQQTFNLLFIMTDQQRWDTLSRSGNTIVKTNNLDRLAAQGIYFENAVTPCPVCAPARTSMLTGCSIDTTGIRNNRDIMKEDCCPMPTYDEILASKGYRAEYLGKWHSPIHRALQYKGIVTQAGISKTVKGPGLGIHYQRHLDKHVPKRKLKKGERLDVYSKRPYIPDPLDIGYGLSPYEKPLDSKGRPIERISQSETYGRLLIPAEHQPTSCRANETIEALQRCKDQPFSITCSLHHPHPPMVLPKPYYGMYPAEKMPIPKSIHDPMDNSPYAGVAKRMTKYRDKTKIGYMISDYYGLIKEIDDHVGRILKKLKELDLEKNTLVIFTSDHGEMLGSHGMSKKNIFYEESVHIPLMMRLPEIIPANSVVSQPASQMNVFATILDYLGLPEHQSQGRSLRNLIGGKDKVSFEYAISEWEKANVPNYMVRTRDWKLMFSRLGRKGKIDALYNLQDDPYEMNNLIGRNSKRAQHLKQARRMKDMLIAWLEKVQSPFLDDTKRAAIT
ncbi:MAG: sulfatase-like hydrolase/transferase [Planctomycetota bacterium]|jgi:arylsulfatase A-like enzyme